MFYFTASLTQGIFLLSVTEPDIWIRLVPGSAVVSGSWSHLLVTVGWSPERLLSAAELHSTETILFHPDFSRCGGRFQPALAEHHPRRPGADQHHGQRPVSARSRRPGEPRSAQESRERELLPPCWCFLWGPDAKQKVKIWYLTSSTIF